MGTATAPNNGAKVPLLGWMALGYFLVSTSTSMGHGNGSVTKGRVLGAAVFLLGLAGWLGHWN